MVVEFALEPLRNLARAVFAGADVTVSEMPGGASLRRFFRVSADGPSAVGMFVPHAATSEEASDDPTQASGWPFLEVQELLASRGVDVPRLLGEDCARGWILVEDLGDVTLAEALRREPVRKTALYQRVVADLAAAHDALRDLPSDSVVGRRAFEVELLEWEIDHFREWALEARGIRLDADQRSRFARIARSWAERVRALEYGFAHRDFQSRNLMVMPQGERERIAWVDFQDALLGPRVYDLVALLGDSYQSFDDAFVRERLREYCERRAMPDQFDAIFREFHLVTVQRKLKDAGRFVFIEHKKGDASYLGFVEPTIALVRRSLTQLASDALSRELSRLLDELVPRFY